MASMMTIKRHPALAAYPAVLDALADIDTLPDALALLNRAFRSGKPLVSDDLYDMLFIPALEEQDPNHPFLNSIESEPLDDISGPLVRHASTPLSTDKAYNQAEIER